jgi:hypothetical protein
MQGFSRMISSLIKAHAYVFYVLRCSSKAIMDDGWEDWKAVTFLGAAMISVVFIVIGLAEVALGHHLHWSSKWSEGILIGFVIVIIVVTNHYTLVSHRKWSRFESDFRHRSKTAAVSGFVAVWLGLLLIVIAAAAVASLDRDLPS